MASEETVKKRLATVRIEAIELVRARKEVDQAKARRDQAMVAARKAGATMDEIAAVAGVVRPRVIEIVNDELVAQ